MLTQKTHMITKILQAILGYLVYTKYSKQFIFLYTNIEDTKDFYTKCAYYTCF